MRLEDIVDERNEGKEVKKNVTYKVVVGILNGSEHKYPYERYSCRNGGQRGYGGYHLKHQQA